MVWSPKKNHYWTPNDLSDSELQYLMDSLKRNGDETKLYWKFWCWKMNYRNKDYGLS